MSTFWILVIAIVGLYFLIKSGGKGNRPGGVTTKMAQSTDSTTEDVLPSTPKGFQIFDSGLVAGVSFRKNEAMRFAKSSNQSLRLEREPQNHHDANAIKVIGIAGNSSAHIGYVPKEISEQIIGTGLFDAVQPRLQRVYRGGDDYLEIHFQIVGPKELKPQYKSYLDNQPATAAQKEFYKHFGVTVPKGLTTGQAEAFIKSESKRLETDEPVRLAEWRDYNSILDDFEDSDFREGYDLKKVSKTLLTQALNELRKEGKSFQYLSENIDEVVEKVVSLKPEIEKA